jgi:hypothetical protein
MRSQLIHGDSYAQKLKEGKGTVNSTPDLAGDIASSVSYAHVTYPAIPMFSDEQSFFSSPPVSGASVQRETLGAFPAERCFQLHSVLSEKECQFYVEQSTKLGYNCVDWEYVKEYRDCERVVVKSKPLADLLWKRLLPHLQREDIADVRPYGFGGEGVWQPVGINPCIRFTRYKPGGHFSLHRDGSYVESDQYRSIFTVMVYLNGSEAYQGGETYFQSSDEQSPPPGHAAQHVPGVLSATVVPRRGTALVFNHDVLHQGVAVTQGMKYILRTDLMFRLIGPSFRTMAPTSDPRFLDTGRPAERAASSRPGAQVASYGRIPAGPQLPHIPRARLPLSRLSRVQAGGVGSPRLEAAVHKSLQPHRPTRAI